MKIKIISAMSEATVEKRVNEFISHKWIRVKDMKMQSDFFSYVVMIIYEDARIEATKAVNNEAGIEV